MTKLIEKNDPRYFSQTSNEPYEASLQNSLQRPFYHVVESWDEVQEWWWNNSRSI